MTPTGFNGAMMQMIAHGVVTGGLFIMVGAIYDRTHDRMIGSYSGLAHKVPIYVGVFSLTMFASLGLPGLAGFVGEFLSFAGAYPRVQVGGYRFGSGCHHYRGLFPVDYPADVSG